jgi:sec-independent protein translocase protein TatC
VSSDSVDKDLKEAGESFMSHLVELRSRLVKAALAFFVVFLCLVYFASDIYDLLARPMMAALPEGTHMIATGVTTPFLVPMKVTAMVAFVIALPMILYQIWAFVAPGLYTHEKRLALPIISSSYLLFLAGMAFTYFFVFRTVFRVIYAYSPKSVQVAPDIDSYLSFVSTMFLAFGLTFEVPVVVVVLVHFGIVSVEKRRYMIVASFAIAAIVTPPDAASMLMLAVPLWLLYEAGIVAASFLRPRAEEVSDSAG